MPKEIILHDAESQREIKVNYLTIKIESDVITDGWKECSSAVINEVAPSIDTIRDKKGTPIRWTDETGKDHFARVIEHPDIILKSKEDALKNV